MLRLTQVFLGLSISILLSGCWVCTQTGPGSVAQPFVVNFVGSISGVNTTLIPNTPVEIVAQVLPEDGKLRELKASTKVSGPDGRFTAKVDVTHKDTGKGNYKGQCDVIETDPATLLFRSLQKPGQNGLEDLTLKIVTTQGTQIVRPHFVTVSRVTVNSATIQANFDLDNPNPDRDISIRFSVSALGDVGRLIETLPLNAIKLNAE